MSTSKWIRVSKSEPCPICEHPDYCTRTADGAAVKCMRVESEKALKSGGWVHQLFEPLPSKPAPKEVEKKADWTKECQKLYQHSMAQEKRSVVSKQLKVSAKSLDLLRVGIGWDWNGKEFSSWPSRDDTGRCIGYVRRYDNGDKRTNKGGSTGLFYTWPWWKHPGPILIVEGGSDVAACETHCLPAIGRASNVHGAVWIRKMLLYHAIGRRVFVVGEHDEKPEKRGTKPCCPLDCIGCAYCWPGRFGMDKVAAELKAVPWMIPEPYKDIREMLTKLEPLTVRAVFTEKLATLWKRLT